jgi:hypothetical protein
MSEARTEPVTAQQLESWVSQGDYHSALQALGRPEFTPGDGSWPDWIFTQMHLAHFQNPLLSSQATIEPDEYRDLRKFLTKASSNRLSPEDHDRCWQCYVHLCQTLHTPILSVVYHATFFDASPFDLALIMAQKGDVMSLEVMFYHFRHILPKWKLLDSLPVSLDATMYARLVLMDKNLKDSWLDSHVQGRYRARGQITDWIQVVEEYQPYCALLDKWRRLLMEEENLQSSDKLSESNQSEAHHLITPQKPQHSPLANHVDVGNYSSSELKRAECEMLSTIAEEDMTTSNQSFRRSTFSVQSQESNRVDPEGTALREESFVAADDELNMSFVAAEVQERPVVETPCPGHQVSEEPVACRADFVDETSTIDQHADTTPQVIQQMRTVNGHVHESNFFPHKDEKKEIGEYPTEAANNNAQSAAEIASFGDVLQKISEVTETLRSFKVNIECKQAHQRLPAMLEQLQQHVSEIIQQLPLAGQLDLVDPPEQFLDDNDDEELDFLRTRVQELEAELSQHQAREELFLRDPNVDDADEIERLKCRIIQMDEEREMERRADKARIHYLEQMLRDLEQQSILSPSSAHSAVSPATSPLHTPMRTPTKFILSAASPHVPSNGGTIDSSDMQDLARALEFSERQRVQALDDLHRERVFYTAKVRQIEAAYRKMVDQHQKDDSCI